MKNLLLLFFCACTINAATIEIQDNDILAGATVNWTKNNTYILKGLVFVDSGATLNIEAGTIIQANQGEGTGATALIVCRKAKIYARGTAKEPVIFTIDTDDPTKITKFDSLEYKMSGKWGGVIILGCATNSFTHPELGKGFRNIEGIDAKTEPRGIHGGGTNPDDNDNSGVFQYVSIRYPGFQLSIDNEINGLTLGSVGRGTVIDNVEIYRSSDDGFEWFGGTVNCTHLVSAYSGDDAFDWDDGYCGRGQFWVALHGSMSDVSDAGGEHSSSSNRPVGLPLANPIVSNVTYIGNANFWAFYFKDNTRGRYYNAIIKDWKHGIKFQDEPYAAALNKELYFVNSIFWDIGKNIWVNIDEKESVIMPENKELLPLFQSLNNQLHTPQLLSHFGPSFENPSWTGNRMPIDLRPSDKSHYLKYHSLSTDTLSADSVSLAFSSKMSNKEAVDLDTTHCIKQTYYCGAFDPSQDTCWWLGWTALDHYGFLLHDYSSSHAPFIVSHTKFSTNKVNLLSETKLLASNGNILVLLGNMISNNVKIDLFDIRGRLLATQNHKTRSIDNSQISLKIPVGANGRYVVRTNIDGKVSINAINVIN